jgi:carbamoyltransferase
MIGATGILAFNDPWHDSSFFLADGAGPLHIESERYSRRKYDYVNPMLAFAALFSERVTSFSDVAVQINGEIADYMTQLVRAKHGGADAVATLRPVPLADPWLVDNFGAPTFANGTDAVAALVRHLLRPDVRIHFAGHHACHAANAFYSSCFERALVVSLDGGGLDFAPLPQTENVVSEAAMLVDERSPARRQIYGAIYDCKAHHCNLVRQISEFSIGGIWNRILPELLGMKTGEEGTAMAMAALGEPERFRAELDRKLVSYPQFVMLNDRQRVELRDWFERMRHLVVTEQDFHDLAAAMQASTEARVRRFLEAAVSRDHRHLCLTGGVFLNCLITGKIREWLPWLQEIYIPPAPYDGGLSVGAAQLVWHEVMGETARIGGAGIAPFAMGRTYGRSDVEAAAVATGIAIKPAKDVEVLALVAQGQIGGLFQGGAESGRRALGNRSIIAHPGIASLKQRLNDAVKHRQWFRPFAPMVLTEQASEWFDCQPGFSSPYMSFAIPVRPERRKAIANVMHLDGTARLQTVHADLSPRLHHLLTLWQAMSGLPVLLNTSFNDREPIVETPLDALRTFVRTPIDFVYFADHGLLARRDSQPAPTS